MNLVFVLLFHVQGFVKWFLFLVSDSHNFTISGWLMSHSFETWRSACIRLRIVSSALPSFCCACLKSRIACLLWAGVVIFWAGVVIPA